MFEYSPSQALPPGYYNRFVEGVSDWNFILFNPSRPIQSSELNEIQSLLLYYQELFGNTLYSPGTILTGTVTSTFDGTDYTVAFTDAQIWAYGIVNVVPAGGCSITGTGSETVSLVLTATPVTYLVDPTLSDAVIGAEAYNKPGADRWVFSYAYVANTSNGVVVANFIDGQLVPTGNTGIIDQILAILAQQKYEEDGSFQTTYPGLVFTDEADLSTNPTNIQLAITGGVAYQPGYRLATTGTVDVQLLRPMTGQLISGEAHEFHAGVKIYLLNENPILDVVSLLEHRDSGSVVMTKGVTDGADEIPEIYQPVYSVISVTQAPSTTYIQGTDFNLVGNDIQWIHGGSQPTTSSNYNVDVTYIYTAVQGIRTLTTVTGEGHTVSGATQTLGNADVQSVTSLVRTSDSHVFVQGTDFTLATNTGVLTWINSPGNGQAITVNYGFWSHTTEGDFTSRDSFRDGGGHILYFQTPTLTSSGFAVDYLSQVSLDTTSGILPIDTTDISFTYHSTIGRVDVLLWNNNGTFSIDLGTPNEVPVANTYDPRGYDPNFVPIAFLNVPPEAVAADVTTSWYPNRTLTVYELNALYNQVQGILGLLDLSSILADIATLLADVATINAEIATLTSNVATLNSEVSTIEGELIHSYMGTANPNGTQAGQAGDIYLWTTDGGVTINAFFFCTTTGTSSTAVWAQIAPNIEFILVSSWGSALVPLPGGYLYLCNTSGTPVVDMLATADMLDTTVSFKNIGSVELTITPSSGESIEGLGTNVTMNLMPGQKVTFAPSGGVNYIVG